MSLFLLFKYVWIGFFYLKKEVKIYIALPYILWASALVNSCIQYIAYNRDLYTTGCMCFLLSL